MTRPRAPGRRPAGIRWSGGTGRGAGHCLILFPTDADSAMIYSDTSASRQTPRMCVCVAWVGSGPCGPPLSSSLPACARHPGDILRHRCAVCDESVAPSGGRPLGAWTCDLWPPGPGASLLPLVCFTRVRARPTDDSAHRSSPRLPGVGHAGHLTISARLCMAVSLGKGGASPEYHQRGLI